MSLEDKIFNYSKTLADMIDFNGDISQLNLKDNYFIIASHVKIENDEWLFNICLYDDNELIDSVYCKGEQEDLEDIIIFLIEEYIKL